MARKKAVQSEAPAKKGKKQSTPKVISMDEVYRLINRVQVGKKEVHFFLSPEDAVIANNVLRDLGLNYESKEYKNRIEFTVHPRPEDPDADKQADIEIDFFQDEIIEEGQLF